MGKKELLRIADKVKAILKDSDGNVKKVLDANDLITTVGWDYLCDAVAKTLVTVTAEVVGTGDGSTVTFSLDHEAAVNIVGRVNAVAQGLVSVDNEAGTMTFKNAPASDSDVTADYEYFVEGWKAYYIAIGTGTDAPAVGDTILGLEIDTGGGARQAGTYSHTGSTKIWKVTTTFTFTASFTITETGVFNRATSGGTLLARQVFDSSFSAVATDTLEVEWQFTLSIPS